MGAKRKSAKPNNWPAIANNWICKWIDLIKEFEKDNAKKSQEVKGWRDLVMLKKAKAKKGTNAAPEEEMPRTRTKEKHFILYCRALTLAPHPADAAGPSKMMLTSVLGQTMEGRR